MPSEALASLIVDELWGSGLAWAQALALEWFDQALRWADGWVRWWRWAGTSKQAGATESEPAVPACPPAHPSPACSAGWLLPAEASPSRGLLKLDLRVQHAGTAQLRMRRWLLDLRRAIGNSSAPCVLDETKRVCVLGTAGGGADAAAVAARMKGELGASLVAHRAPFRLSAEGGRAQRLESSSAMARKWLFSGERASSQGKGSAGAGSAGGGRWRRRVLGVRRRDAAALSAPRALLARARGL